MIEQIYTFFTIEMLYMWINIGVLPFWFILIFFPQSHICRFFVTSIFPFFLLGGAYIFILYKSFLIGYDFDDKDKSDAKTCTLRKHDAQFTLNKIEHKIGSLRIVVYNEITDRLDYFYVTKVGRENRLEKGYLTKDRLQERMRSRYNIGRDDYCSFENFRCDSFVELATMSDKKMEKKNPKVKYLLSKSEKYQDLFDEQFV